MAREKATVVLDRKKVEIARSLIGARSMSEVIDVALDRMIREEQLRHDIAAYTRMPPTDEEMAFGGIPMKLDLDDDDIDYEALYGDAG